MGLIRNIMYEFNKAILIFPHWGDAEILGIRQQYISAMGTCNLAEQLLTKARPYKEILRDHIILKFCKR